MRIMMIGDVVGSPGRKAVSRLTARLRQDHKIDLIVANGENAAGGKGITKATCEEMLKAGVDVLTMGNHVWDKREAIQLLDEPLPIYRPANYPPGTPGRGFGVIRVHNHVPVGIAVFAGRVFLDNLDCPFRQAEMIIRTLRQETPVIFVDFHAEATSEKVAFGWHLDGQVSAVVGTHTHVQTADERILPQGTAYITDVGMTGPIDGVLGVDKDKVLERFITQMPVRFEVATGEIQLNAVIIDVNQETGRAQKIYRIQEWLE